MIGWKQAIRCVLLMVGCLWQWQEVLDILADALDDNNITYRMLHTSRKFEVTVFFGFFSEMWLKVAA